MHGTWGDGVTTEGIEIGFLLRLMYHSTLESVVDRWHWVSVDSSCFHC
jgi:hypothetical protein